MAELDARLREEHLTTLTSLYQCFEAIHVYSVGLVQLVEDLQGGRSGVSRQNLSYTGWQVYTAEPGDFAQTAGGQATPHRGDGPGTS